MRPATAGQASQVPPGRGTPSRYRAGQLVAMGRAPGAQKVGRVERAFGTDSLPGMSIMTNPIHLAAKAPTNPAGLIAFDFVSGRAVVIWLGVALVPLGLLLWSLEGRRQQPWKWRAAAAAVFLVLVSLAVLNPGAGEPEPLSPGDGPAYVGTTGG